MSTTFTFGTNVVVLRDPDFDNVERFETSRLNTKTRGGDLVLYRDPMWPVSTIFDWHFSYLSEKQTQDLLRFLDLSLGQDVTVTDFEGRTWVGVITTPAGEVVQPERQNKTAHIVFQVNQ
jgi:hypothetical protein